MTRRLVNVLADTHYDGLQQDGTSYREAVIMAMQKKQFEALARAAQEVEQGLVALSYPLPQRNDIMELVTARLALACAKDNPNFDSFTFNAACRKALFKS